MESSGTALREETMENITNQRSPEGQSKGRESVFTALLDVLDDMGINLRDLKGNPTTWTFYWDNQTLEIGFDPSAKAFSPEDQWFLLGGLLEEMDTRATGAGLELEVVIHDQVPGAWVKPQFSISKGHPLAFPLGGGFRTRSPEGVETISPQILRQMNALVAEPGVSLLFIEKPQDLTVSKKEGGDGANPVGFVITEGKSPLILVRAGRAFERLQLLAKIWGFRLEVSGPIGQVARRCWKEAQRGVDYPQNELLDKSAAEWGRRYPDLVRGYSTVAFHFEKSALPLKPATGTNPLEGKPTDNQINAIVDCARWAPSGDNVQPFSFAWDGTTLSIIEDRGRSSAFLNVGNAASQIALGMCLQNIKIGSEREGWAPLWTMGKDGHTVATVTFKAGPARIDPMEEAIKARTVDRRPYRSESIPAAYAQELAELAKNPWGIRFHLVNNAKGVGEMARINGGFESFLFAHRESHDYFYRWIRKTDKEAQNTGDGLPVSTLGINAMDEFSLRLLASWGISKLFTFLGLTRLATLRARRVYKQSAAFGAFTVPNHDPETFVRVGLLWQKLWLKMSMDGWSLQPIFGNAMMGLLCRTQGGQGLTEKQKTRFSRESKEMGEQIQASPEDTIACVFRMGRSMDLVPARAPRLPLAGIFKTQRTMRESLIENERDIQSPLSGADEEVSFDYGVAFSRNLGLVQKEEQLRLKNSVVAIAGMGGVGGVHVTTLARLGVGRFHLADFDRFELHNFNRQTGASVQTLGREKVEVMAEQARSINPSVEIRSFSQGVTAENVDAFLDGVDVVVDGLDFFVPEAREILYDAADRRKIPLVTAGPIGMSMAWLVFLPGQMSWRDYFRFDRATSTMDKLILFALGLTPRATQMGYMDRRSVDFPNHRGPSLSLAVQLCAGVAAGEVLKIILKRGTLKPAPCYHQFDAYQSRYVTGTLRWGNAGWWQRIKFLIARRWICPK